MGGHPEERNAPLLEKIEEIGRLVRVLQRQVSEDAACETIIEGAGRVRGHLDELEKSIVERFGRDCLSAVGAKAEDNLGQLLVVLNRLFK